jgi:hypothetical protein
MWICFPSIEPTQFGKFQRSRYRSAMHFHFTSFGGGMNRGCNVDHIAVVVSAIMPEIVLFPLIN